MKVDAQQYTVKVIDSGLVHVRPWNSAWTMCGINVIFAPRDGYEPNVELEEGIVTCVLCSAGSR